MDRVLLSWNFEPLVVLGLLTLLYLYVQGSRRLAEHGGMERQIGTRRIVYAVIAFLALIVALMSPIAVFGNLLLSAHMTQHLLLQQVAAAFFVLARPAPTLLLGLPAPLRQSVSGLVVRDGTLYKIGSVLTTPLVSVLIFNFFLFGWHFPVFYDLALANPLLHQLEHLTFFGSAVLLWWAAIDPITGRNVRRRYFSIISQAVVFVTTGLVGIYLSTIGVVVYRTYALAPRITAGTALDDQILGGLIMWVAGGMIYAASGVITLIVANNAGEKAQVRREKLADAQNAAAAAR